MSTNNVVNNSTLVQKIAEIDPKSKYVFLMQINRNMQESDIEVLVNKVELKLKNFGVRNVKVIPHTGAIYKIMED